jgi:hypothetical protein
LPSRTIFVALFMEIRKKGDIMDHKINAMAIV